MVKGEALLFLAGQFFVPASCFSFFAAFYSIFLTICFSAVLTIFAATFAGLHAIRCQVHEYIYPVAH